jgi:hypothetical protein
VSINAELAPDGFKFFYYAPFYHATAVTRRVMFGALQGVAPMHAGILLLWLGVSVPWLAWGHVRALRRIAAAKAAAIAAAKAASSPAPPAAATLPPAPALAADGASPSPPTTPAPAAATGEQVEAAGITVAVASPTAGDTSNPVAVPVAASSNDADKPESASTA